MYDELIGKLVSGEVVVTIAAAEGSFQVDIRSHILKAILLNGNYEPEIAALIRAHLPRDRDAIDVGANIGIFSVFMARQLEASRRVLAIEPTPSAIRHLKQNLVINQCERRVILEEKAATAKPGTFTINVIAGMEEYSTLGGMVLPDTEGRKAASVSVKGETVDALVERHGLTPGFMKIDAEGSEHLVLEGASRTLQTFRPVVLTELVDSMLANFGTTSASVLDLLRDHGYEVHNVFAPGKPIHQPFTGEILARPKTIEREPFPKQRTR